MTNKIALFEGEEECRNNFIANINNMLDTNSMPTLGTKEFNDMCSSYFGGKPKKIKP